MLDCPNMAEFLSLEALKRDKLSLLIYAMEQERINPTKIGENTLNYALLEPIKLSTSPATSALNMLEALAHYGKAPNGKHYKEVGLLISYTLMRFKEETVPSTYIQRMRWCIEHIAL